VCTRANKASIPDSLHALAASFVGLVVALVSLVVAMLSAPARLIVPRPTKHGKPASVAHVEVQIHLDDGKRAGEIERGCRYALRRAARTWAPHPLPLDRVEVLSSAPPLGKTDIYDGWVGAPGDAKARSLVVVSLGMSHDQRLLTSDEIAGALFGQIQVLVDERYRREHGQAQLSAVVTTLPERKLEIVSAPTEPPVKTAPVSALDSDNVIPFKSKSVQELLADIKKSQPLVPADPSQNGVHPEPTPA
jgi:hypothetical protein